MAIAVVAAEEEDAVEGPVEGAMEVVTETAIQVMEKEARALL